MKKNLPLRALSSVVVVLAAFVACSLASVALELDERLKVGLTHLGNPTQVTLAFSGNHVEIFSVAAHKTLFSGPVAEIEISASKTCMRISLPDGKTFTTNGEVLFSPSGRPPHITTVHRPSIRRKAAYRGSILVFPRKGALQLVNVVMIEEYLRSVVPSEMWNRAPDAAQQAQAIAARSYAHANRLRHGTSGFDLCDKPHCQMYTGIVSEIPAATRAIEATRGHVAWYKGEPINAVYHQNCGGTLLSSKAAWGGIPISYLPAHEDRLPGLPHFCKIGRAVMKGSALKGIPRSLPPVIVRPLPHCNRSKPFPSRGHRVGLCQIGAIGMAAIGYSATDILAFYYPGSHVGLPDRSSVLAMGRKPVPSLALPRSSQDIFVIANVEVVKPSDRLYSVVPLQENREVPVRSLKDTLREIRRSPPPQTPVSTSHQGFRKWFWASLSPLSFRTRTRIAYTSPEVRNSVAIREAGLRCPKLPFGEALRGCKPALPPAMDGAVSQPCHGWCAWLRSPSWRSASGHVAVRRRQAPATTTRPAQRAS